MKNENKELLTLLENDNNFRFEVKHAILSQISTIEKRINLIKGMRRQDEFTADTVRHFALPALSPVCYGGVLFYIKKGGG